MNKYRNNLVLGFIEQPILANYLRVLHFCYIFTKLVFTVVNGATIKCDELSESTLVQSLPRPEKATIFNSLGIVVLVVPFKELKM